MACQKSIIQRAVSAGYSFPMAKTTPFFRHVAHVMGLMSPAPAPERYPYHDIYECPTGQEIKVDGEWQYYEPNQVEETRDRCPKCTTLDSADS